MDLRKAFTCKHILYFVHIHTVLLFLPLGFIWIYKTIYAYGHEGRREYRGMGIVGVRIAPWFLFAFSAFDSTQREVLIQFVYYHYFSKLLH